MSAVFRMQRHSRPIGTKLIGEQNKNDFLASAVKWWWWWWWWLSWSVVWLTAHAEIYFHHLTIFIFFHEYATQRLDTYGSVTWLIWHRHRRLVTETKNSKTSTFILVRLAPSYHHSYLDQFLYGSTQWNSVTDHTAEDINKLSTKFHAILISLNETLILKNKKNNLLEIKAKIQTRKMFALMCTSVNSRFESTNYTDKNERKKRYSNDMTSHWEKGVKWAALRCSMHIKMTFLFLPRYTFYCRYIMHTRILYVELNNRTLLKYHQNIGFSSTEIKLNYYFFFWLFWKN